MMHIMMHCSRVKNQLTIRGLDKETEAEIRELARRRGISLNKAAILLLRKGAGVRAVGEGPEVVADSLNEFVGTWSRDDEAELLDAVSHLDTPDESLWP